MCLAQGQNTVMMVRLEHLALWSLVKQSTTEPPELIQAVSVKFKDFSRTSPDYPTVFKD